MRNSVADRYNICNMSTIIKLTIAAIVMATGICIGLYVVYSIYEHLVLINRLVNP